MSNLSNYIEQIQTKIEYQCKLCGKKFNDGASAFDCVTKCMIKAAEVAAAILAEQCADADGPCAVEEQCLVSCANMDELEMLKTLIRMQG